MLKRGAPIVLAVFLMFLCGVIAWEVWHLREPVYQGKRLSIWLQSYTPAGNSPETDEALQTIGTNAIPILLDNLRANDSALKLKLAALGLPYTLAETRHLRAEKGFTALGDAASNAAPDLCKIYEQSVSASGRRAAGNSLVEIGPAARTAIPALIRSAASTNSDVRAFALYTLGRMALESELVVPVLIKGLHDPDREVRFNAAFGLEALAFMGGDAKPAIPALVKALKDSHVSARASAAAALGHIHSEPDVVIPALIEVLRDSDAQLHALAARAIGEFGGNGKPAVAPLIELLGEGNQDTRKAATNALKVIDPEAAAKAEVK
jgi:HEAT repeat protein